MKNRKTNEGKYHIFYIKYNNIDQHGWKKERKKKKTEKNRQESKMCYAWVGSCSCSCMVWL